MNVMPLHHPFNPNIIGNQEVVLALGFFDGVHRGHQAVIKAARQEADKRGLPLALMTFNQHPKIIYQKINPDEVSYLTLWDKKRALLESFGVDLVYLVDYSVEFGSQTPQEFVDTYLVGLHAQVVVAGFDYTYGLPDIANMQTLPQHAQGRFDVVEVPPLLKDKEKIASRSIKDLLLDCQITEANLELGYTYENHGRIIHGDKRGRTIGYPTANISVDKQEVLPGVGVYVVEILVKGKWYQGMASIGYNITFEANRKKTCEVYILDFNEEIYDEIVTVKWHHYLRNEIKFDGIEGLVSQLDQDLLKTKAYFKGK